MKIPEIDKNGGRLTLRMYMTKEETTVNTKDYGGMPKSHGKFGEYDKIITGSEWEVSVTDAQGTKHLIGRLLFQGMKGGLIHIDTFNEMLGCNKCNDQYHRNVRYGPFINDGGSIRKPLTATARYRTDSSCKKTRITGNKADYSTTFEGGPGVPRFTSKTVRLW